MTLILVVKVTLLFVAALGATLVLRRGSAAMRHKILASAQLAALVLPLFGLMLPPISIDWAPTPWPHSDAMVESLIPPVGGSIHRIAPATQSPRRIELLAFFWLAGCAGVVAARLASLARAMKLARRARPFGPAFLSEDIDQPATFGRTILLPAAATSWDSDRLRAVILHEQAHVMRHDTLLTLLGDAACAVYWFHPLVWILALRARLERERACDDRVLTGGVTAEDYASALIEIARNVSRQRVGLMAMAAGSQLEVRIRSILDPAVVRGAPRRGGLALVLVFLAAAPLLAALTPSISVPRPQTGEPDLLGDAVASPFSERIEPAAPFREIRAGGRDAALIALMSEAAVRQPRTSIDFVPERARWALTRADHGELVAPLIDSLGDPDWRIRAYAAWVLGYSADRRAVPALLPLLDEPIWRVRAMAAHSLANLGIPGAEEALLRCIDDPAWQVRTGVVRYLGARGGYETQIEAMRQDRHMAVRAAAEQALEGR